jgi:hypothetical protein
MAQQIAWTTLQVPGSLAPTGNPRDTAGMQSAADSRCPRCERRNSEQKCNGVLGDPVHLGS